MARTQKKRKVTTKDIYQRHSTQLEKPNLFTKLALGESFTSLILGLLIVIALFVLGISFLRVRHTNQTLQNARKAITADKIGPSMTPTATPTPVSVSQNLPKTYTTVSGDTLWSIAEKFYKSGYNWVDIAKANHLENPDLIFSGNQLTIPQVATKTPQTETAMLTLAPPNRPDAITGDSYTVQHGDDLWHIAERAYGDGNNWVDIAKANHLENPDLIFSGNVLSIPR